MSKWKIGITGITNQELIDFLKTKDFEIYIRPWFSQDENDCIKRLKGMDAVLAGSDPFTIRVLDELSDTLKIISRFGIGVDAIDLKHAGELGIVVCNAPGSMSTQVSEHTIGLILALYKKILVYDKNTRSGIWKSLPANTELEGKTVGLIGFGSISRKLVHQLKGFDCKIIAYDPNFNTDSATQLEVQQYKSIDTILSDADIVSLHLPATPETQGLVDENFLSKMKKDAILINTSRGSLVREKDLFDALNNRVIAGAGLDVMETEPPGSENPLYNLENIVITPHVGWNTKEGNQRVSFFAADRILEAYENKEIKYVVNAAYLKK